MKTDSELIGITESKINEFYDQLDQELSNHLFWMISQTSFMEDTRKLNRWLGFIQGTLVAQTDCTIDELRELSR